MQAVTKCFQKLMLFGQLEDADLNQFGDGQVVEALGAHALDECGRDLEDAHLDELV